MPTTDPDIAYCYYFPVDTYSYVVNGTAKQQIMEYMAEEHTFDEYCGVMS